MPEKTAQICNNLNAIREQTGVSAAHLAEKVGVSRQTIYAIEKGTYVPNTTVGLRLARALGVTVEQLFSLSDQPLKQKTRRVTLLPTPDKANSGQPVQLCDVDGRLMGIPSPTPSRFLPPSDAFLVAGTLANHSTRVQLHDPQAEFGNRLLVAGCDPAMALVVRYLQPAGITAIPFHQNSTQALGLLKRGYVHCAGTHLQDAESEDSNVPAIRKNFPADSVAAFSFAIWQEGLVVASGNPSQIEGVGDLARREVHFLNREPGAGTRALLDRHLKRLRLDATRVSGYNRTASGHLAAARAVMRGVADCSLTTEAAARVFGLGFIPLQASRFDLVVRKQHLQLPAIQTLLNVITSRPFRAELRNACGYDTAATGSRVL